MTESIVMISLAVATLLFVLLYPFVWGNVLRARMLKKLRNEVRAEGYKYRRFYKNIFLVHNRSSKYDLIIYNEERLYAVKLWSSYFVDTSLILSRDGRVHERRMTRKVFAVDDKGSFALKGFSHSVPKTKLGAKYRRGRKVFDVLLVYPSYKNVMFFDGKREVKVSTGDEIMDKLLYSPYSFTNELKKYGTTPKTEDAE